MSLCSVHPQIGQLLIFSSTSFISKYIITQVLFEVKVREIIPVCMIQLKRRSKDLENRCSATVVYEIPICPYYLKYLIA
jgi:hypothetical protein